MKFKYRDCEVSISYEKCLAGYKMWFWSRNRKQIQ